MNLVERRRKNGIGDQDVGSSRFRREDTDLDLRREQGRTWTQRSYRIPVHPVSIYHNITVIMSLPGK